jgi:holo-[acyl-carrier protein] synthase
MIGIDIENIGRFVAKPYLDHTSFYQKIFTAAEIKYCLSKNNPYPSFAVRFCAKEAFIKAIGQRDIPLKEIEVIKDGERPFVVWQNTRYTVSLSHDQDKAVAAVIIQ